MSPEVETRRLFALARERGLALTVQRRAVLADLAGRRDHPTADAVFERVRRRIPSLSRTTVYRVLEVLAAQGVIQRASHPGSAARYDPVGERHHHLVCVACERMADWRGTLAPAFKPTGGGREGSRCWITPWSFGASARNA